ncbi:hypothetical protein TorRG33x02_133230 [Trema orientale]|uniref:Uncharacterized protein n=1 Tax=Trema orientale TaxID=63057 RepID=A0A2P5EZE9_TREOI|nr:hypothetical protein TorRG33x02_133230 [Trema orientale]
MGFYMVCPRFSLHSSKYVCFNLLFGSMGMKSEGKDP